MNIAYGMTMALLVSIGGAADKEAQTMQSAIRIVMVGDSTMATYTVPREDRPDLTGWGQVFGERFNDRVTILNHAESGRSAETFLREGRLARALADKPDYVFIQFGHNDHLGEGGSTAGFRNTLRTFIDEARAANAKPVLVTPMTRRKFRNGRIVTSLRPFAEAMIAVGKEKHVPVIDLHASSVKLHNRLGEKGSAFFNPSKDDETHFTRRGAQEIARLVAEEIPRKVPALKAYLKMAVLMK